MHAIDAIETINVDQIATVTDRILLGGVRKRRPPIARTSYDVQYEEPTQHMRRPATKPRRWLRAAVAFVAGTTGCAIAMVCLLG